MGMAMLQAAQGAQAAAQAAVEAAAHGAQPVIRDAEEVLGQRGPGAPASVN